VYGMYWLDFLDQWDPKSPWHDRRVRLAASLALDRNAINQAEMIGLGRITGSFVPPTFDFALHVDPPPFDPKRAKQLLTEAGFPRSTTCSSARPRRWIASSARRCSTRSSASSPIARWWLRSSSRASSGAWAHASPSRAPP